MESIVSGFPARTRFAIFGVGLLVMLLLGGCDRSPRQARAVPTNAAFITNGTVEVIAKLLEIPDGAIFQRDLYDYATVLKYQVIQVQRGALEKGATIYVAQYNPWKPRQEAVDRRVKVNGGNLGRFQAGQIHHLALDAPLEDHFMGGIVNKYFEQATNVIYWAVWTDLE